MARQSLERIKNHYEFYQKNSDIYEMPEEQLPMGVVWNKEYRLIMLELVTDDGCPYLYGPSWVGYYERLIRAEIIIDNDAFVYEP